MITKYFNYKLLLGMVIITLFILTSCAKKDMTGVAISQGGYSIFNNTVYYVENSSILKYIDANTGKTGVLCSKPNCKHELYDEKENPDPTCNAVAKQDVTIGSSIIIDDILYYTASKAMNLLIFKYDYKNDKCEMVAEIEKLNPNYDIIYLNGNLYFNCISWAFEDGGIDDGLGWKTGESIVCKYNIKDRSIELLFKDMNLYINTIYPGNNDLYACCFELFSSNRTKQHITYIYDEKKCKKVSDLGYYYFDDNNGYINPPLQNAVSNKIMKYNFKTQDEEELCTGWVYYSYLHYLIYSDDSGKQYRYDSAKNETEEIKFNNDYAVLYLDNNYVIYNDFIDENNPNTYIVETEKFFNGSYEEARLIG